MERNFRERFSKFDKNQRLIIVCDIGIGESEIIQRIRKNEIQPAVRQCQVQMGRSFDGVKLALER